MNVGPAGTLNRQWMMKRGIDMIVRTKYSINPNRSHLICINQEMKKGLAPVGDYSTAGFFNKGPYIPFNIFCFYTLVIILCRWGAGGRQRPDGTGRKTLPKKEGRQRVVDQNKEDVDSPAAGIFY